MCDLLGLMADTAISPARNVPAGGPVDQLTKVTQPW
jgi:hypothetical protein